MPSNGAISALEPRATPSRPRILAPDPPHAPHPLVSDHSAFFEPLSLDDACVTGRRRGVEGEGRAAAGVRYSPAPDYFLRSFFFSAATGSSSSSPLTGGGPPLDSPGGAAGFASDAIGVLGGTGSAGAFFISSRND